MHRMGDLDFVRKVAMRAICGMFIMAGVLGMATAARAADSDVAADVVANVSQVKQGQGFLVGLRLKTHEGWHV